MLEMLASHKEILNKLEKKEHKLCGHDDQILLIFEYKEQLEQTKQQVLDCKLLKRKIPCDEDMATYMTKI